MPKKDETEIGITGLPIPKKKRSPRKQYEFEKKRRENLGTNVGGQTYSKDVTPGYNPRQRTFEEFMAIIEAKQGPSTPVKHDPQMGVVPDQGATRIGKVRLKKELKEGKKDKSLPPNAVPGTYSVDPETGAKSYTLKPAKPTSSWKKPLSKKEVFKMLAKQGGIGGKAIEKAQKNK